MGLGTGGQKLNHFLRKLNSFAKLLSRVLIPDLRRINACRIKEKEQQQAAKLAKLEARVVATTPNTAANTAAGKVAVVKEQ